MKIRIQEFLALVLTLIVLAGVPITVYSYAPWAVEDIDPRVIHLTGVAGNPKVLTGVIKTGMILRNPGMPGKWLGWNHE